MLALLFPSPFDEYNISYFSQDEQIERRTTFEIIKL